MSRKIAMPQEKTWKGYYKDYVKRALLKNTTVVKLLDEEWYDGKTSSKDVLKHVKKNSVVLEIGCGAGRVSSYVAPHCKKLFCVDILDEALKLAKNELEQFDNVEFKKVNGYDLKCFPDKRFDLVYSFATFIHFDFELALAYLKEIKRVLKKNGIFVIEFHPMDEIKYLKKLEKKILKRGGIAYYTHDLDKWRFFSKEWVKLLSEYLNFIILDDNLWCLTGRFE